MTPRKRKRPSDFAPRVNAALDRIAATIEDGELMLATEQPAFFEAVADKLEVGAPTLGQVVREHRQRARLTGRQLATRSGQSHEDIRSLERGGWAPSVQELARVLQTIADAQWRIDEAKDGDLDARINGRGYAPEGTSFLASFRLMPRHLRGSIGASMRDFQRERELERAEDGEVTQ